MKKLILMTGAVVALGVASSGYAAALAAPGNNTGALPGLYIGAGAGIGGMDTPKLSATDKTGTASWSEKLRSGVAARAYLGYLWAIPQMQNLKFGAEFGGSYYPQNKYTRVGTGYNVANKYKGYNVDLLAVGKCNLGNTGLSVIAKGGAAYTYQELVIEGTGTDPLNVQRGIRRQVLPKAAVGVGYDINQNIDVNLMYDHVFGKSFSSFSTVADPTKIVSVNTFLLSVAYHFGGLGKLV